MLEPFKKSLLSALGVVPLRPEDVRGVIAKLVERGDLNQDQGRKVVEALLGQAQVSAPESEERLRSELSRLGELMPLATRGDLQRLAERVRRLEERLSAAPGAPEGALRAPEEVPAPGERRGA